MTAAEILETLERGGYDFSVHEWKDKDRLRVFALTLAKNNAAFHRLPNGTFGLPKWYPEAVSRKNSAKAERESAPADETAASGEDLAEQS